MPHERERDVLADAHRIEESALLERHPELLPQDVAFAGRDRPQVLAVDLDRSGVGLQQPDDVLEEDALPDSRLPEEDEGLAPLDGKVEVVEDDLRAEGLRDAAQADCRDAGRRGRGLFGRSHQNSTFVRKKSAMRIASDPRTTAAVVATPSPSAPPFVS